MNGDMTHEQAAILEVLDRLEALRAQLLRTIEAQQSVQAELATLRALVHRRDPEMLSPWGDNNHPLLPSEAAP